MRAFAALCLANVAAADLSFSNSALQEMNAAINAPLEKMEQEAPPAHIQALIATAKNIQEEKKHAEDEKERVELAELKETNLTAWNETVQDNKQKEKEADEAALVAPVPSDEE
eukprot:307125_1